MRLSVTLASIFSDIGEIFHPLFWVFAQLLAFFYSLVPNYIIAITLLTILVMVLTAPLTVKSTKSMMEMQRIQPEFKKLQQKYKGDREKLNEEVMKLYREHGVSPVGGCLPLLLQMPFFICLYGVIKGLVHTSTLHGHKVPTPLYLGKSTKMYHDVIASHGKLESFGIDLSQTPFQHHGTFAQGLPYWIIFFAAIGLQYIQMARLNKRNAANTNLQNNPQMQTMQTMQKVTPLIFGVIYIAFPIGVTVYFIVSSLCRIIIQEILFRAGVTAPKPAGAVVPGARDVSAPKRRTFMDRLADAQATAQEQRRRQMDLKDTIDAATTDGNPNPPSGGSTKPPSAGSRPKIGPPGGTNGKPSAGGNGKSPAKPAQNGSNSDGSAQGDKPKAPPQRAKDKRPRKAR